MLEGILFLRAYTIILLYVSNMIKWIQFYVFICFVHVTPTLCSLTLTLMQPNNLFLSEASNMVIVMGPNMYGAFWTNVSCLYYALNKLLFVVFRMLLISSSCTFFSVLTIDFLSVPGVVKALIFNKFVLSSSWPKLVATSLLVLHH